MPTKKYQNPFEATLPLAIGMMHGASEELFGPDDRRERLEGEIPFEEREENEQEELLFEMQSLVSEQRDLKQTIRDESRKAEELPAWELRMVGGRAVKIPVPTGKVDRKRYEEEAIESAQVRLYEVKENLIELGDIPGLREAYEQKMIELYALMRVSKEAESLRMRMAEIDAEIASIRAEKGKSKAGVTRGASLKQIALFEEERKELEKKIAKIDEYQSGYHMERFMRLKKYAEQAAKGRMVEFPSAERLVSEGLEHMRRHQPLMLAGHLGSGKTEYARHMARLFMLENGVGYDPATETPEDAYNHLEPEMFSGGDEASVYDLIGKLKLVGKSASDTKILSVRTKELEKGLNDMGVRGVPKEDIAKLLLGKGDVTETVFNYGPLGRALRDGKPIVIDEINLMPPEVVGRINDLLLRPVGSKVRLQENGEEEFVVKPGFAVISTLNLGHQYSGIKDVNAAFASRWIAREVDYPSMAETYDLVLASLVRKDRVRMPPDFPPEAFDALVSLAAVTREIQETFSGQTEGRRFMALASSVAPEATQLERTVVSTRDLMNKVIKPWKDNDFKELPEYAIRVETTAKKRIIPEPPPVVPPPAAVAGPAEGEVEDEEGATAPPVVPPPVEAPPVVPKAPPKEMPIIPSMKALDGLIARNIIAAAIHSKDDQKFLAELFMRRGFFQGWTESMFREAGIQNVSKKEIDALGGSVDEFTRTDPFGDVLQEAHEHVSAVKTQLLMGTRGMQQAVTERRKRRQAERE